MPISGSTIRRMRRLRNMKQEHLAELLAVNQATVSRWERDILPVTTAQAKRLESIFASASSSADAALKRLVEDSRRKVHLICDRTHRLLAASNTRQSEWRLPLSVFLGKPLFSYASDEIVAAERGLTGLGWHDGKVNSLTLKIGENGNPHLPILAGQVLWERIVLADGSVARLVTTLD
ncbi:transcriptional regulator with XRE-family HTH domain [Rhizobium sp. BK650]|uniref:helix-turn-helix domain-containing protein n=1 Tax=Rhizobium sp. BK650 TaxID=2586990 RepID=UPI001612D82F|nr:helix-turn-helix transcriptional regulator [Rhizobium sp. BK650]MBB3658075.1 transcriptional regulator with XRE-family HTH domain [Rhizobium sp. BK650]